MLVGVNHLVFQPHNLFIAFLPPDVTSVVQPLDKGKIASFKVRYKKKLLEWVLSQFDSCTHRDLIEGNNL